MNDLWDILLNSHVASTADPHWENKRFIGQFIMIENLFGAPDYLDKNIGGRAVWHNVNEFRMVEVEDVSKFEGVKITYDLPSIRRNQLTQDIINQVISGVLFGNQLIVSTYSLPHAILSILAIRLYCDGHIEVNNLNTFIQTKLSDLEIELLDTSPGDSNGIIYSSIKKYLSNRPDTREKMIGTSGFGPTPLIPVKTNPPRTSAIPMRVVREIKREPVPPKGSVSPDLTALTDLAEEPSIIDPSVPPVPSEEPKLADPPGPANGPFAFNIQRGSRRPPIGGGRPPIRKPTPPFEKADPRSPGAHPISSFQSVHPVAVPTKPNNKLATVKGFNF